MRQFSACRPLNCDLDIVTSQYSHSHVENLYGIVSCVCSFSVLLARLTLTLIPLLVAGSVFGNGLQTVSVLGHARKLSFRSCCVSLVHAGH